MAYVSNELIKEVRENLKKAFPEFKFSVVKNHHSEISVAIMKAPVRFADGDYVQLNHYYPQNYKNADILEKIIKICNEKNYDNSDIQSDYFSVGYYFTLRQGKWDRPFICTGE